MKFSSLDMIIDEFKIDGRIYHIDVISFFPEKSSLHVFNINKPKPFTLKDIYKTYLSFACYRIFFDKTGRINQKCVLFNSDIDENSVLIGRGLDNIIKDMMKQEGEEKQFKRIIPLGDGVMWEISRYLSPIFANDSPKTREIEPPSWYFDFTLIKTYNGQGYRFTLLEPQIQTFLDYLEQIQNVMLDKAEEI